MADRAARRSDLALAMAILFSFSLGAICLAIAFWGLRHPPGGISSTPLRNAPPELGFLAGPIFIGFGVSELVHRLRSGPQPQGRHARSSK